MSARSRSGKTALHYAFEDERARDIIQLLIDYGAELSSSVKQAVKNVNRKNAVITLDEARRLLQRGKEEKASMFTAVRDNRVMIPELWDIVMSYTKIPGYVEHVR